MKTKLTNSWLFILLVWIFCRGDVLAVDMSAEINKFGLNVFNTLSKNDYAGLEMLLNPYLDSYGKHKITEEDLSMRFGVFSGMTDVENELTGWVQAYPKS